MANEFIGKTQSLGIDNPVIANGDGIFQRRAQRQARGPEALDILHETECACARQLIPERVRCDFEPNALVAGTRVAESKPWA